jgi:hypothetical protein
MRTEYGENLDPFHNIQQQLFDTFDLVDRLCEETPHVFKNAADDEFDCEDVTDDMENLESLYRDGTHLVYDGTNVSIISATIVLINMAVIHGVSNAYVDELLIYLSIVLLSQESRLPTSHYEERK